MFKKLKENILVLIAIACMTAGVFVIVNPEKAEAASIYVMNVFKYLTVGGGTPLGKVTVYNNAVAQDAVHVRGVASQTADFLDVTNSAGTEQFKIDASGRIHSLSDVVIKVGGAPVDGSTGNCTVCGKGSLHIDATNGLLYINEGDASTADWEDITTP